ncbi:MAG: hypothetical protein AAGF11_37565 [Myxococcota bacterium]
MLLLFVLVAAGFAAYWFQWSPAAKTRSACHRLEDLCGAPADRCIDAMDGATPKEIEELAYCVEPADSCLETVGCATGSALRQLGEGAARGLLR